MDATIQHLLSELTTQKKTLKSSLKEQKFQDALALDRLRDLERDISEAQQRIAYGVALDLDIERDLLG
jgi:hypothetical protein